MELDCELVGRTALIRCRGARLDAGMAVQFKERFREMIGRGADRIILDLCEVQFLDSSGLGAIVAVYKALDPGQKFDIAGLTPPVERVFRLTRMDSVFSIFENAAQAMGNDGGSTAMGSAG